MSPVLAIFSWFGYEMPLSERIARIARAGFAAASLWWGPESLDYREERHHVIPTLAREHGLMVDNVHVSYRDANDIWREEDARRRAVVDQYKAWLDDCGRHEIPIMVMHLTKGPARAESSPYGLDSMREIVAHAESCGVVVAVENVRRVNDLEHILDNIDSPHLGLCYDISHDWIVADEPGRLLAKYGERLVATHFSDNDGERDRHCLPGRGVIEFDLIAGMFPAESYAGTFSLEVVPTTEEKESLDADAFLQSALQEIETIRELFMQQVNRA